MLSVTILILLTLLGLNQQSLFAQSCTTYPCWSNTANINDLGCVNGIKPVNFPNFLSGGNYVSGTDATATPYQTGLYPGGTNTIPAGHLAKGLAIAQAIKPLNASGQVDQTNGTIKAYGEGMSNTLAVFCALESNYLTNNPDVNSKFTFDNQAQGGCDLICWEGKGAGTAQQDVQLAFLYHSNNRPQQADGTPQFPAAPFLTKEDKYFPSHAQVTKDMLKSRILQLKQQFPNLKIAYLSARDFGGWTCPPASSGPSYREPVGYEENFSAKWLIEDQINGDPSLAFEGAGAVAPWLCWGPYTWEDSKAYPQAWWQSGSGTHPCPNAADALAQSWYNFLISDPTSNPWFASNPGSIPNLPPLVTASVSPTSGPAPLNVSLTGTASDNDGVITAKGWIFGDGGSQDNILQVNHTYLNPGIYNAIFWATDDSNATRNDSVIVTVTNPGQTNAPPIISISANPMTGTVPLSVQFSATAIDTDGTVDFTLWNFGDQTEAGGILDPQHTYQDSGFYWVVFTATDNLGDKTSDSLLLRVNPQPVTLARSNAALENSPILNISPNPFNLQTSIAYHHAALQPLLVSLSIFDLQGYLVRILQRRLQTSGYYTIVWNGTNLSGNPVKTGIYLVKLKIADKTFSQKVVLMK